MNAVATMPTVDQATQSTSCCGAPVRFDKFTTTPFCSGCTRDVTCVPSAACGACRGAGRPGEGCPWCFGTDYAKAA